MNALQIRWFWWNRSILKSERAQSAEEGKDMSSVEQEFIDLLPLDAKTDEPEWQRRAGELMDKCRLLPMRPDYQYIEPSDLEGIRKERRTNGPKVTFVKHTPAERREHIHSAWLGRIVGCYLGKPIESILSSKLWPLLDRLNHGEITDYLWNLPGLIKEDCDGLCKKDLWSYVGTSEYIGDDDTNFTVANMELIRQKGVDFTSVDVANFWMANFPLGFLCTAEKVAYRHFINGIAPPESALIRNPYREWIGAQIRGDFFGYVALGNPELAAELAWRDASISHVKNGIYGEMWVAAMIAAALDVKDSRTLIEIGLNQIPEHSRFFEGITDILNRHARGDSYKDVVKYLHTLRNEKWCHGWCHTIGNAQIVALGMLYGEGDFEKSITKAVYPCFDTDCNGATVGSIIGMMVGLKGISKKWTECLHDTIHTSVAGYSTVKISEVAEKMFQLQDEVEQTKNNK